MRKAFIALSAVAAVGILVVAIFAGFGNTVQQAAATGPTMDTAYAAGAQDGWAVCAYDGMVMKKRGMGATAQYKGKTLYFCNQDHKNRFMANPAKYQRTWKAFGDEVAFNILPMSEHMAAMSAMGMKMEAPQGDTHHVTLCIMAGREATPVADAKVSAKITPPGGKAMSIKMPLASDRKHYAANVKLTKRGEYKVSVTLSRSGKTESHSFVQVVS
jgi:YHS domain-containing protein